MTHPLELQRRNMIEYQQIDNEGNHIIIDGKSQMPLICTMGAAVQHGILLEYFPKHFQDNPFEVSPTDDKVDILKTVELIQNDLSSKHATSQRLHLICNTVIIEAKECGFNIEGIYNAIAENNLARIDRDENGKPKRNLETQKIMRKDMHPDLKPFIL